MRILYGVVGEGMGHATRSKVVCEHLVARGHDVKIVVSGRAHAFLSKTLPRRRRDRGPHHPLRRQPHGPRRHAGAQRPRRALDARGQRRRVLRQGRRISSPTRSSATSTRSRTSSPSATGCPIVSIDNQQIISRCKLGKFAKQGAKVDYQMTKAFVRAKLPGVRPLRHHDLLLPADPASGASETRRSFRRSCASRSSTRKKGARAGDHVLVYQTSTSDTRLLERAAARRASTSSSSTASQERAAGQLHAQGVQRGRLRRRPRRGAGGGLPTAGSRSSARRSTWASRSSASRCATSTSRCSTRATSSSSATASRRRASRPTSCGSFSPSRRSTRRASRSTSRTATASSSRWSTSVLERFARKAEASA